MLKKACENDTVMMNKICGEGSIWVNYLLKLLALNDLHQTQLSSVESTSEFIERIELKTSKFRELVGIRVSDTREFHLLLNIVNS